MTGPRFKPVRFGLSVCEATVPIVLTFDAKDSRVEIRGPIARYMVPPRADQVNIGAVMQGQSPLDFFARADGFSSWSEMEAFWRETHGNSKWPRRWSWSGVMICWKDFRPC